MPQVSDTSEVNFGQAYAHIMLTVLSTFASHSAVGNSTSKTTYRLPFLSGAL